jgi:hypothetical protein
MERLKLAGFDVGQFEGTSHSTRWLWATVGGWTLALAFIHTFPFLLGFFQIVLPLLVAGVTFALFIACLVALRQGRRKFSCLLALVVVLSLPLLAIGKGKVWGALVYLQLNKGRLESTVAKLRAARDRQERANICGNDCFAATEPPLRVRFYFSQGFFTWNDIVYDPTGEMAKAEGSFEKRRDLDHYLSNAQHLTGDWYLAHFDD